MALHCSQKNGPNEETDRNKKGSQHESPDSGLHRNCQTPHVVCLQCLVICCKDLPRSADQSPKHWTENHHRWYEDHLHLRGGEDSKPPVNRGKKRGETLWTMWKDKEASFTFSALQIWMSHRGQVQDTVQITWSKHFSNNTSSVHQHATNSWKSFKTLRTGEQKL